ncbi:ALK tyrosine kinase receptor isoform X1, partial [Vespula squamosa]
YSIFNTIHKVILVEHFGNSESGYSYASSILLYVHFQPANPKPGEVYIIPTTRGCACNSRCVDLNPYLTTEKDICMYQGQKKYKTEQPKAKSNNRTIDVAMISTAVKSTQMRHGLRWVVSKFWEHK